MVGSIVHRILALHGWPALAVIFAVPALEASAFVGFLFPGEIAVLLGGVLAFQGRIDLTSVLLAAVAGAIVGDSIGYSIGRRWGRAIMRGAIGRLPVIRHRLDEHLNRAQEYLRRRGGRAVLLGRFTAALRVLVPGLAGMSGLPYPTFLLYNAIGGTLWATGFVLLGYFAGASYRRVEGIVGKLGLLLLGVIVAGLAVSWIARRSHLLTAAGDRIAATSPFAWIRGRFPTKVAWTRRRLNPFRPTGLPLTFTLAVGGLCVWAFGSIMQDVVANEEAVRLDPPVESFVLSHREAWLTALMKSVTWLGSIAVLIPVVVMLGGYFLIRKKHSWPAIGLITALVGAVALYHIVKRVVERPRPPLADSVGYHFSGWSFPSGHATQATAVWGMLALVLAAQGSVRSKALVLAAAAIVIASVGASRLYLGAHWLTDVLGGLALGGLWLCVITAAHLVASGRPSPLLSAPTPPG